MYYNFFNIRYSLAVPSNKEENRFIRETMSGDSWIGISDIKKNKEFRSVNDNRLGYEKWDSGQPDDGSWFFGMVGGRRLNI